MESLTLTNSLLIALLSVSALHAGVYCLEAWQRCKEARRIAKAKSQGWKF